VTWRPYWAIGFCLTSSNVGQLGWPGDLVKKWPKNM
jgi:hypothetical protein